MPDLKLISNNASQKYALQVTFPSGKKFVFTLVGKKIALMPQTENGIEGTILAWDTPAQVQQFLKEIKAKYPREYAKIWEMKPDVIPVDRLR